MKLHISAALCSILLAGCSSSSSTSEDDSEEIGNSTDGTEGTDITDVFTEDNVNTGVFIDSAVQGLEFSTATQSGVTDQDGTLSYLPGESVTLSIGQLSLPAFPAKETMSPIDVFDVNEVSDTQVLNLAVLLQSLDADSNADNGIEILDVAASSAPMTIDFLQENSAFVEDPAVLNLIANSGSTTTEPVSVNSASQHLQSTLVDSGDLEVFDSAGYGNLIIGNTVIYSGGQNYYYRPDGVRFAQETEDLENIVETSWEVDETGAFCEVTTGGTMFCPADVPGFMLTRGAESEVYNYSDDTFVTTFTVIEGDSLSLSDTDVTDDFIRINTLESFNSEVVDRTLLAENGDQLVVTSSGTVDLLTDGGTTELGTWDWQNSLFCRVVATNNDAPMSDCQVVELNGNQVRFTRNEGAGEEVVFTIQ